MAQNAQVAAHVLNTQATSNAVDKVATHHGGHGLFGATLSWLGGGIKGATDMIGTSVEKVAAIASKPLSDVQHQYRYLRDVEEKHGFGAMLGVAIPMAAGAAAGAFLGGPQGAILGAEGAGAIADRLMYKDSWARTNPATYKDAAGQSVSPGRDAARFLGMLSKHVGVHIEQHAGFDLYDAISGAGDAIFDIEADPLMKLGALHKEAMGAEGARGLLAARYGGTALAADTVDAAGQVVKKGSDMARITAQYPKVQKTLEKIATMDAGQIVAFDKRLAPFAKELGAADSWDKVGQVLKDNADAAQMRLKTLPRQGVANAAFKDLVGGIKQKASEMALGNPVLDETGQIVGREGANKLARGVGKAYSRVTTFVPTSFNETTQNISRTTLYLNDPSSAKTIYDMAKWGHTEQMAQAVAKDWATGTIQTRMTIFRNVMTDNLINRMEAVEPGWSQTATGQEHVAHIADAVDHAFGGIDAGRTTPWGFDAEGRVVSKMVTNGETVSVPVLENQHFNVPMPDYMTFDQNLKSLGNGSKMFGAADDFLYRHFTQNVFKKWVLASGGFALRVASGELLPFLAKDAPGIVKGKLAQAMAEHGWELAAGEDEHLMAPIVRFMASKSGVTDEQIAALGDMHMANGSHWETSAVRSGHGQGHEIIGKEEYVKDSLYSLKREVPKTIRVTDEVQAFGPEKDDQWVFHHKQAVDMGQSPATQAAAQAYRDVLGVGQKPFGMTREQFKQEVTALDERVRAAEKTSDPATWTAEERAAYESGDTAKFSKLRGYTDAEIADHERLMKMLSPTEDYQHQFVAKPDNATGIKASDLNLDHLYDAHVAATPSHEAIAHEIATKAAEDAADKAVRRAAAAKPTSGATEEGLTDAEIAAKKAAEKKAREIALEEIPQVEGGPAKPKVEGQKAPLSPELQAVADRAREEAYKEAYKAALKASQDAVVADAEKAAIDAAKGVLDSHPENILDQHVRHFTAPDDPEAVRRAKTGAPEPEGEWKWVGGKPVTPELSREADLLARRKADLIAQLNENPTPELERSVQKKLQAIEANIADVKGRAGGVYPKAEFGPEVKWVRAGDLKRYAEPGGLARRADSPALPALKSSIANEGIREPLVLHKNEDGLRLLEGHHRLLAVDDATRVPVVMSDESNVASHVAVQPPPGISVTPHWELQPHDPAAPLVTPTKLGPGNYEYQASEGTYSIRRTGKTWTMTSPVRGEQEFETWGKAVESMSRTTARAPQFIEGSLEMPTGYTRVLEEPVAPAIVDPHQAWAQTMVENMKGTIRGQDGSLHDEILHAIAEGRAPDMEYMKNIPQEARPFRVMGEYEKPAAPDRLSDRIFNKLNGVINWMAREPIYQKEFLDQFEQLKHLEAEGLITRDELIQRAQIRATNNMLPNIHNINERTLMAEHSRNFIPFYFAQQQSYARMFRLLAEDPQAFRKVQLAYSNLANFGGLYGDTGATHQMILPGTGFVSGAAMGLLSGIGVPMAGSMPTAFSGNLKSLASLSPFLEGGEVVRPGPLVSMAVRGINNLLPETRQVTDPIMGTENQSSSFFDMVIPNAAIRNVVKAFSNSDNRTQVKSVLDAVQSLEYQQNVAMRKWTDAGKDPNDPKAPHLVPSSTATDMERQDFINRVKNQSRILTIFKSIIGSLSPVAPSVQIGDFKLKDELYTKMKELDPATGKPIGIAKALQDFLAAHPDATPYTVFETDSGTSSPIDSTHPAQQWVTQNMDFITDKRYSAAASYFVPQTDSPFDQQVYNEQMAMGLRHIKAPDQLIKDIHVSEGNRWYFDTYKPAKDAAVAAARSPHEREQISAQFTKQGDPAKGIQSLDSMKLANPLWYSNFSSGARDVERQLALAQMQDAIDNKNAPDSPMTDKLAALLKDYQAHSLALLPGRTDSYASAQRTAEKANWQRYLKKTADEEPDLAMVINNIFRGV